MSTRPVETEKWFVSAEQRWRVENHLRELLHNNSFSGSHRGKEFLHYIVTQALDGRGPEIKERNIATDVFGRDHHFDPQTESIVRVCAVDVRKRLAAAYKNGVSRDVRIELPVGSYQPHFQFEPEVKDIPTQHHPVLQLVEPEPLILPSPIYKFPRPSKAFKVLLLAVAVCIAATALFWSPFHHSTPLDIFWDSVGGRDHPVLIAVPSPKVYELKHLESLQSTQADKMIPAGELLERKDKYIGVGAGLGAARFAERLTLCRHPFFLKFGSEVSFSDLKRSPTILLGSYSSPWSIEMNRRLRFRFEEASVKSIVDSASPEHRWASSLRTREGYALVTRLVRSDSGEMMIIVAGLSPYDTEAAVTFLTEADSFNAFVATAPREWPTKNFQIVVHHNMHGNSAGRPQVVTSYVW